MCTTSNFHNKSWFSDIAIAMDSEESDDYVSDQGLCYGQVIHQLYINNIFTKVITLLIYCLQTLLLAEVLTDFPLNLALIQWYDFKSKKHPYLYGYPYLKLVELYNFVAIESIEGVVHIVTRFNKTNEYFINKYIFQLR